MKVSQGFVISIVVIAGAAAAFVQFRDQLAGRFGWAAADPSQSPALEAFNGFTEEQWTIMEVCDQIVFLLQPELIKQAAPSNRITAERNRSEPVSYSVAEGPAKGTITLSTSVWDPATYQSWCKAVSLDAGAPGAGQRPDILNELLTPETANFLALDDRLSAELARSPRDPQLHLDAALLLGTMAWFDAAGHFQDVRPLLNRMTAFLAAADALGAQGKSREVAEMLRLVLTHDQTGAMAKIIAARTAASGIPQPWLDALEVTATEDWRKTEPTAANGPVLLQLAHFRVLAKNIGTEKAESFLKTLTNPTGASWTRYLTQTNFSIEQGHQYTRALLDLEAAEAATVAKVCGQTAPEPRDAFLAFVTHFDGLTAYERAPETRVVGGQLWAGRTQRHFLQSAVVLYDFLENRWGVPEQAAAFTDAMRQQFSRAYYYPFLTLQTEEAGCARSEEALAAAEKLTREHPATVAPKLWAALKPETPESRARQTPDFHGFYRPELPRHTSFEAGKRIYEIGVGDENSLPLLQGILARCPYDFEMAYQTAMVEGRPNQVEAKQIECTERFADIHDKALKWAAGLAQSTPEKYARLMLRRAQWYPGSYLVLANYFNNRGDIEQAEKYLLLGRGKADSVHFANQCGFLVRHYAVNGRLDEAEDLAKEAAETYSAAGLITYGWLKEYQEQWRQAAETYQAIDERYGDNDEPEYVSYILRRNLAGRGWLPEYQKKVDELFPRGIEKVSLASIGDTPPGTGLRFGRANDQLRQAGISPRDVIVAIDGIRVENSTQYTSIRALSDSPDMVFILWNGKAYVEIKAHQPGRRFNVDLRDYRK